MSKRHRVNTMLYKHRAVAKMGSHQYDIMSRRHRAINDILSTTYRAKKTPCQNDFVSICCLANIASCHHDTVSKHYRAKKKKKKEMPCQNEFVSTRSRSNTPTCQYDVCSHRHRVNTTPCQAGLLPRRRRVKTMSCQHDVVSRRHRARNDVV